MCDEPATFEDALSEVHRLRDMVAQFERERAWADGRRGDGVERVAGFTITETRILRILAAHGSIRHEQAKELGRFMSYIRAKLPPEIRVKTVFQIGYEMEEGRDVLKDVLAGVRQLPAPAKRVAIAARELEDAA